MTTKGTLLTVSTEDHEGNGYRRSNVKLFADAVAYVPERYGGDCFQIMAMSIIGPEQAIRAVGAGCALDNLYQRTLISFRGDDRIIRGRWAWGWKNVEAKLITPGAMHLVVTATSMKEAKGEGPESIFVMPDGEKDEDLYRAIYGVLEAKFSTPLIPCDLIGQPPEEKAAGEEWRKWICQKIVTDEDCWQPAMSHPAQPNRCWARAGILTMTDEILDGIVAKLVRSGRISIPQLATEAV